MAYEELFNLLQSSAGGGISVSGSGVANKGQRAYNPRVGDVYDPKSSVGQKQEARRQEKIERETAEEYRRTNIKALEDAGRDLTRQEKKELGEKFEQEYHDKSDAEKREIKDIFNMDKSSVERGQIDKAKENPKLDPNNEKLSRGEFRDFLAEQERLRQEQELEEKIEEGIEAKFEGGETSDTFNKAVADANAAGIAAGGGGGEEEAGDAPPFTEAQMEAMNEAIAAFLAENPCKCECTCGGGGGS